MVYHIHGWLIPHFCQLRAQNKLKQGTKQIEIEGIKFDYVGELDEQNKAYGEGIAENDDIKLRVMTMNDKIHGLCKCSFLLCQALLKIWIGCEVGIKGDLRYGCEWR